MELPNKKYQIIYADPPWHFKNYNDNTASRWVGNHYDVMSLKDIQELPIRDIADNNCVLFLWVIFPFLDKAFDIIESWGFKYKTVAFVWIKTNKDNSIFTGMGYWTRSNAEICLLATKGKPKRINNNVHQILLSKREQHSKKPDEIRNRIVELLDDIPKIELFARQRNKGWDVWGNHQMLGHPSFGGKKYERLENNKRN